MNDDSKSVIFAFIASLPAFPTLIFVVGAALLVCGLAGGINYNNWLVLEPIPSNIVAIVGGALIAVALLRGVPDGSGEQPNVEEYMVKIAHPQPNDVVSMTDMRGTIKKLPPKEYKLYALRMYPDSSFYPMCEISIDRTDLNWNAIDCDIGAGNKRDFAVFLVGPGGLALIGYYKEATRIYNSLRKEFITATSREPEFLPLLKQRTPDMIECARVSVRR